MTRVFAFALLTIVVLAAFLATYLDGMALIAARQNENEGRAGRVFDPAVPAERGDVAAGDGGEAEPEPARVLRAGDFWNGPEDFRDDPVSRR